MWVVPSRSLQMAMVHPAMTANLFPFLPSPKGDAEMVNRIALALLLVPAMAVAAFGDEKTCEAHSSGAQPPAFEAFKQLAGEWRGKMDHGPEAGKEIRTTYKVTSGGSAVVETMSPGTDHEMVTVIHPDGDDLVLTHYCMLGNQPQMRASGKLDGKNAAFKFVRVTNLKSEKGMYMHDVTFTFEDKDTIKSTWNHYNAGKVGSPVVIELKRVK
jgi:hypothetical protein